MVEKSYRIPKENLVDFEGKIEQMNRRIQKMGKRSGLQFPTITYKVSGLQKIVRQHDSCKVFLYYDVTLQGDVAKIKGWTLIAIVDKGETGNTLRQIPGTEIGENDLVAYRHSGNHCEHCNSARDRKALYIVRNEKGETKQVGRNCCKEFLGFDPHYVASYSEWVKEFDDDYGYEESEGCFRSPSAYNLAEFLAFTIDCIRADGWIPKSRHNGFDLAPTALQVDYLLNKTPYKAPTQKAYDKAKESIVWAKTHLQGKAFISDYEHNLSVILEQEYVLFKQIGLAASIIPYITKEKGKEVQKHHEKKSQHSGTIGTRETFDLTYITNYGFNTDYGYMYIHKFEDSDGNIVVWKTGKDLDDIDSGVKCKVTGKVIKHETYKGINQTVVNRCKIVKLDE